MYNGYGISTPRGTGTSGYIMKNKSYVRPYSRRSSFRDRSYNDIDVPKLKKANNSLVEHEKKREIELDLLKMRIALEEKGEKKETEIEKIINDERDIRFKKLKNDLSRPESFESKKKKANIDRYKYRSSRDNKRVNSHGYKEAQVRKNELFAEAVGINLRTHKTGEAFNFEDQEKERKKRKEEREREERDHERRRKKREKRERKEEKRRKKRKRDERKCNSDSDEGRQRKKRKYDHKRSGSGRESD